MDYNSWGLPKTGMHAFLEGYPNPMTMLVAMYPVCSGNGDKIRACGFWRGVPMGYLRAPTNMDLERLLNDGEASGTLPINVRWRLDGGNVGLGIFV